MTRWWWIRHAPTAVALAGRLDIPCDTGDAAALAALAARLPTAAVLVESGLLRCRQTAAALRRAGAVLPAALIASDLVEQDFGAWQGKSWQEIEAPWFWRDPAAAAPPGGESFASVMTRVAAAVARLEADHGGGDIVAVVHAGTIRAALALALALAPAAALRLAVAPLSLSRIDRIGDAWRVEAVNLPAG